MEVIDNLTSTATDVALSANQGRILKEAFDELSEVTLIDITESSKLIDINYGTKIKFEELNNYYKHEDIVLVIGSNYVYVPKEGQLNKNLIYYKDDIILFEITLTRGNVYLRFTKRVDNLVDFYVQDFTLNQEIRYMDGGIMSNIYKHVLPDRLLLYGQATWYIAHLSSYNTTEEEYCYTFADENNNFYLLKFFPNTNPNRPEQESRFSYKLTKLN